MLRSFDWREEKVDALVLRGAVAFWVATAEVVDEADEDKNVGRIRHVRKYCRSLLSKDLMGKFIPIWRKHL